MGLHVDLPASAGDSIQGREPFRFRHRLQGHRLLSLDALARLADQLPADSALVERFGDASFVPPHRARGRGRSPGELVRDIGANGCWADLRHVERVPAYRELVEELLAEVLGELPRLARSCISRDGFVFVTAPRARTPAHSDPEHNFYLQIAGTKHFALTPLEALDPAALAAWQRARGYEGGYRRPLHPPPGRAVSFTVEPGEGLYVPLYAIHDVSNGDEVSVALSVTCRTRESEREYLVHALHRHLAALGVRRGARRARASGPGSG